MSKELEKKALVALGKTDASTPTIIGRYVAEPFVIEDGFVLMTWKQHRFFHWYRKTIDLDRACAESGMKRESALRFLRKPDIVKLGKCRDIMDENVRPWDVEGRWRYEGHKMFLQEKVPRHRIEIWREFGDRLDPKPGKQGEASKESVNINISADVISSIRERERSVEAEIVNRPA